MNGDGSMGKVLQDIIGDELMEEVCKHLGGERVYIPTRPFDNERNDKIEKVFVSVLRSGATCMNAYELAANDAQLSISRVRQIVAAHR